MGVKEKNTASNDGHLFEVLAPEGKWTGHGRTGHPRVQVKPALELGSINRDLMEESRRSVLNANAEGRYRPHPLVGFGKWGACLVGEGSTKPQLVEVNLGQSKRWN